MHITQFIPPPQYGNLECCAPHGAKGRRTIPFGGYADAAEAQLMKYALKTLGKLASKLPTKVSRGLHLLVAPTYGGEPVLPPHLQEEEPVEELPMLPPRPPTALELRAERDARLAKRSAAGE